MCGNTKGHAVKAGPTPGQQLTAYFIEWNALISSSGIADDPLFVVGNDHINPEDIDVHVVPRLNLLTRWWQGDSSVLSLQIVQPKIFH